MRTKNKRASAPDEKTAIEKARLQLLAVGVICVSIVVAALWLTNLRSQFVYHRKHYPSARELFSGNQADLGDSWRQFNKQLNSLR